MSDRTDTPMRDLGQAGVAPSPSWGRVLGVFALALAFVVLTRWPVARDAPVETDEFGFLETIAAYRMPMHHTLFLASARLIGNAIGDPYRGFIVLDMVVSALALTSAWWWLRALVRPATATAAVALLAVSPLFWAYGALAGNYTAIPLVGCFLLGIAVRTYADPRPWHPYAAALALALGTGYRQDIGTFWLPVFFVILWPHRWKAAIGPLVVFTLVNLAWLGGMVADVGWAHYREASAEFAHEAGYRNSFWNLGVRDAPLRYAVKLTMALAWTLGPALLFVPRGISRTRWPLVALLALSVVPALGFHLFVHFGVPGYSFHDLPALLALVALGIGRIPSAQGIATRSDQAPARLACVALVMAALFLAYPTNYKRGGLWGDFDIAFARLTRVGLKIPRPDRTPAAWPTAVTRPLAGDLLPGGRLAN
ncbi:glycosyltransferase family 39 protein [Isosphaeraceae bacterium EP7]